MEKGELKNEVLQTMSTTPDSTSDAASISRFIEYIQSQLSSWSIDHLVELWKCLVTVSYDHMNLHQIEEATKCWIAEIRQSEQEGNSASEEKICVSDASSVMKSMDMEFQKKYRKLYEENVALYDNLEHQTALINRLKVQHSNVEKQLKDYIQKYQDLEVENYEQRDQLNEAVNKERTMALALQKYTKEHQNLMERLETAEIEVQAIPSLKEELEIITKEKIDCIRLIDQMQKELEEKEDTCAQLRATIVQFNEETNGLQDSYENKIRVLRERNRQLTDENVELQSLSALQSSIGQDTLSFLDADGSYVHSTPFKSKELSAPDSLYMELKSSGFIDNPECNRQKLEEELNEYDAAIDTIVEQLEKVIQLFVTMRGSIDDRSHFNPQDTDGTACINVLKCKTAFLLYMVTEEITRRNARKDSSTQLQTDPANAIDGLSKFNVRSFQDLMHTCRSIYPLSSSSQSLQSSSLTAEHSQRFTFGCQNSETNAPIVPEDSLTQKDRDKESTLPAAETIDVSDQKDTARSEENREMSKTSSTLQTDSKATLEKESSAKSFQVPEVSSANNPSPRRKISVYCRTFDATTMQVLPEDHPGSSPEVKQSSSNSDDFAALAINNVEDHCEQGGSGDKKYSFNDDYRNAKNDSDSLNSTPEKSKDNLLDDESPVKESISRKVHLVPTRLIFLQEAGNNSVNSTRLNILDSSLPLIGELEENFSPHEFSIYINRDGKRN